MRRKARESKVEEIPRDIAWRKSGKMVVFLCFYERCSVRFSHFGCPTTLRGVEHPPHYKSSRAFMGLHEKLPIIFRGHNYG